MKTTKVIIAAALMMGAAALSANAGVRVGVAVGLPVPVVVATSPVVLETAPVVETVPPSPGVDYVWTPGYYTVDHVWMRGCWNYRPTHFFGRFFDRHDNDRHDGYRR